MATSNFNFSVAFSLSLAFFLVLLTNCKVANSTGTVSFTFNNFAPVQPNLILQRDAVVTSSGVLRLTKVDSNGVPTTESLGRVLYAAPVQIWDSVMGTVASWATAFAFNISVPDIKTSADGLAFFLAPVGSQPQSIGGYLGVFNEYPTQAVAVEFDTHCSNTAWDPLATHIGIDVNRIRSVETVPWGLANGQVAKVLVTYDASTSLLVASLVYPSQRNKNYIISAKVDLKNALPEWVSVGLSATTGTTKGDVETHDVLSWSFASKFSDGSDAFDLPSFMLNQAI